MRRAPAGRLMAFLAGLVLGFLIGVPAGVAFIAYAATRSIARAG